MPAAWTPEPVWASKRAQTNGVLGVLKHMLSAFASAFGPGDTVMAYTSQKSHVVETLRADATHVQKWADTAAYNLENKFARDCHQRAYRFMEREFTERMGTPRGAPVWVGFDFTVTAALRKDDDTVLVLKIPRSEILLSMYDPWSKSVLDGWCVDHDVPWGLHLGNPCRCPDERRNASWKSIFNVSGPPTDWQGVMDRIDPQWLVKSYAPGESIPEARIAAAE